jgi:hypothetical protein
MHYLKEFSRALWLLRAPVIVVAFFMIVMQQEQIQEIYAVIITGIQDGRAKPVVLAALSLIAFCLTLWAIGRDLSLADFNSAPGSPEETPRKGHILRNMPAIVACLPLVLVTVGMMNYSNSLDTSFVKSPAFGQALDAEITAAPSAEAAMTQTLNAYSDKLQQFNDLLGVALDRTEETVEVVQHLKVAVYTLAALTIFFAAFVFWRANFSVVTEVRMLRPRVVWAFVALFVACLTLAALQSVLTEFDLTNLPRTVGVIFIINLFLICIAVFMAVFTRLNDVQGIPVFSFIIVAALVASANNWNDNHAMRTMSVKRVETDRTAGNRPAEFTNHPNARPLPIAFLNWFDSRPAARRDMFAPQGMLNPANPASRERKYPVYIVAAQGGGLYSAYMTAMVLARMYDQCPALRHHIFAISGVSGGSVGAGLISGLLQDAEAEGYDASNAACPDPIRLAPGDVQEPGRLELRVKDYFAADLLSPLAASALFADFPQRVAPFMIPGVSEHFDRSRAFEASLETLWERLEREWEEKPGGVSNPFRAPFRDHWREDGHSPMLVLNITAVDSGQQVLAAPFVTDRSLFFHVNNSALHSLYPSVLRQGEDIRLSTAVGLSARFPLVLSPGSKEYGRGVIRFGDGGYYENSGVDTALAMVRDLKFYKDNTALLLRENDGALDARIYENIEFRLIILNEHYTPNLVAGGFHETMSPLRALYNTRTHRGRLAIDRALASGNQVHLVRLMHGLFPMPLGWQFANHTSTAIHGQLGTARECYDNPRFKSRMRALRRFLSAEAKAGPEGQLRDARRLDQLPLLARILQDNRCSQRAVIRAVSPDAVAEPL